MKLRNLFIAVMTVVIAAASCQKLDKTLTEEQVKVEFTVADKPVLGDMGQTKAVKSAWADGDQIILIFKKGGTVWVPHYDDEHIRFYMISYDEGTNSWDNLESFGLNSDSFGTGGEYLAIHSRGNILSFDNPDKNVFEIKGSGTRSGYWYKDANGRLSLNGYDGGELMFARGTYTFSESESVLSLSQINMALDSRLFQISVPIALKNTASEIMTGNTNNERKLLMSNSTMSVFANSATSSYLVSMKGGAVSLQPDESEVFYVDRSTGTTGARAVINGSDASYCFMTSNFTVNINSWRFKIESGTNFNAYRDITKDSNKSLSPGKAYRLPEARWAMMLSL